MFNQMSQGDYKDLMELMHGEPEMPSILASVPEALRLFLEHRAALAEEEQVNNATPNALTDLCTDAIAAELDELSETIEQLKARKTELDEELQRRGFKRVATTGPQLVDLRNGEWFMPNITPDDWAAICSVTNLPHAAPVFEDGVSTMAYSSYTDVAATSTAKSDVGVLKTGRRPIYREGFNFYWA